MTDLLEAMMKDSGIVLKDLRVDRGASVSHIIMQIQADMTGVNVPFPPSFPSSPFVPSSFSPLSSFFFSFLLLFLPFWKILFSNLLDLLLERTIWNILKLFNLAVRVVNINFKISEFVK